MPYVYQYVPGPTQGMPAGGQFAYTPGPPQPQGQLEQLRAAQAQNFMPAQAAPMTGPAQPQGGINWVQGLEGAKSYLVAPGASVLLMDSERQSFYIKAADGAGMPLPLRIFDYHERVQQAQPVPQTVPPEAAQAPAVDYATREELEAVKAQLRALEEARAAASQVVNTGGRKPAPNSRKDGDVHE